MQSQSISFVIPAKNEEETIAELVSRIRGRFEHSQIIVVDDGSDDRTADLARAAGALVLSHPYSCGNGAAVKTGARAASGEVLVFLDADGQHDPDDISLLLQKIEAGWDLAIGAREGRKGQASLLRWLGNGFYNKLASSLVGHRVRDLTSGFRAVRREYFVAILDLLPNGFSYPTTSTMAFFRAGHRVAFVPIRVLARSGAAKSHVRVIHDGARFLTIIFRVATLYSPLKVFIPIALALFMSGMGYYLYTFFMDGRFTNMGVLLFVSSIFVFMIGLVSEQVTTLIYLNLRRIDSAADQPRSE